MFVLRFAAVQCCVGFSPEHCQLHDLPPHMPPVFVEMLFALLCWTLDFGNDAVLGVTCKCSSVIKRGSVSMGCSSNQLLPAQCQVTTWCHPKMALHAAWLQKVKQARRGRNPLQPSPVHHSQANKPSWKLRQQCRQQQKCRIRPTRLNIARRVLMVIRAIQHNAKCHTAYCGQVHAQVAKCQQRTMHKDKRANKLCVLMS